MRNLIETAFSLCIVWLSLAVWSMDLVDRNAEDLTPRRNLEPVRLGLHGQTKRGAEVELLTGSALDVQTMEDGCQEHKHLQASETVSEAAALAHAEDHHLFGQVFVKLGGLVEKTLRTERLWVAPDVPSGERIQIILRTKHKIA